MALSVIKEYDLKKLSLCISESHVVHTTTTIVKNLHRIFTSQYDFLRIEFNIKNIILHAVEVSSVRCMD